jgi:hypothetical protein
MLRSISTVDGRCRWSVGDSPPDYQTATFTVNNVTAQHE